MTGSAYGSRPAGPLAESIDHGWFNFAPLPARPPLAWPDGAGVAVAIVLDLRAVEWERPELRMPVPPPGGRGFAPYPDFPRMSHREFGHRVGVFRLLSILAALEIRPAVAIDVLTVEHYGALMAHLRPAAAEFLAGGLSASRPITGSMSEAEERHYVALTMDRLTAGLGRRPRGWLGPEFGESARTPQLLAEAGLEYVADWGNDEQPYPMTGVAGQLWSLPLSWELSDLNAMFLRGVSPDDYGASLVEALDVLQADSADSGRMLALHLHPWISGRAFCADAVETALHRLHRAPRTWWASPAEIVAWCRSHSGR